MNCSGQKIGETVLSMSGSGFWIWYSSGVLNVTHRLFAVAECLLYPLDLVIQELPVIHWDHLLFSTNQRLMPWQVRRQRQTRCSTEPNIPKRKSRTEKITKLLTHFPLKALMRNHCYLVSYLYGLRVDGRLGRNVFG